MPGTNVWSSIVRCELHRFGAHKGVGAWATRVLSEPRPTRPGLKSEEAPGTSESSIRLVPLLENPR